MIFLSYADIKGKYKLILLQEQTYITKHALSNKHKQFKLLDCSSSIGVCLNENSCEEGQGKDQKQVFLVIDQQATLILKVKTHMLVPPPPPPLTSASSQ